jgi:hypothetical protein
MSSAPDQSLTLEQRVDRLESREQIRTLSHRYALAVDSRNLDDLVALFVEDAQVGRSGEVKGRPALRAWFSKALGRLGDTVHYVTNQVIDLDSDTEAHGVVTCRDEVEIDGEWRVGAIQYWDQYERHDGIWLFRRRKLHRWYLVDALSRPTHGGGLVTEGGVSLGVTQLPEAWPSWAKFWAEIGRSPR